MAKKKLFMRSVMATSILLSSFPTEAIAAETSDITTGVSEENTIENTELIVSRDSQTDTSITVAWTSVAKATSYSVYLDGNLYSDNVTENALNITGLTSASEHYIIVKAHDESNEIISTSNELCAHTNLTVSANMTLTQDLFVSDLFVDYGTLNLNGYSVYVNGDVSILANEDKNIYNNQKEL